jgi:hypothetical protein
MGANARAFARRMFPEFAAVIPLKTAFPLHELLLQTDLQIAAQVWLMQAAWLDAVAEQFGPERVRTLKSTTLLADKAGVLARLGEFFGLGADDERWAAVAAGPVFERHAKTLDDTPFDAAKRDEANAVHAKEVAAIMPWAEAFAKHCGAPLDLGDTLLSAA